MDPIWLQSTPSSFSSFCYSIHPVLSHPGEKVLNRPVSLLVQDGAADIESRPECERQQADQLQELSLLQFLKSQTFFLLIWPRSC